MSLCNNMENYPKIITIAPSCLEHWKNCINIMYSAKMLVTGECLHDNSMTPFALLKLIIQKKLKTDLTFFSCWSYLFDYKMGFPLNIWITM